MVIFRINCPIILQIHSKHANQYKFSSSISPNRMILFLLDNDYLLKYSKLVFCFLPVEIGPYKIHFMNQFLTPLYTIDEYLKIIDIIFHQL